MAFPLSAISSVSLASSNIALGLFLTILIIGAWAKFGRADLPFVTLLADSTLLGFSGVASDRHSRCANRLLAYSLLLYILFISINRRFDEGELSPLNFLYWLGFSFNL